MGLSCWLDREMKKGDNVHLYQCESTRAPGFITDIKQRKQKYIYIYVCVCVCAFFSLFQTVWEKLILLVAQNAPSSVRLGISHARRYSAILRLKVSQFRRLRRAIHRNATEKDRTDREEAGNRWFAILKLLTGQCRLSLRVFSDFGLFGEPPSEFEKI